MNRIIASLLAATAVCAASAAVSPAIPADAALEKRVSEVVSRLTLEEKVGQMCELTLGTINNFDPANNPDMTVDAAKLHELIGKYKVGSFLNTADVALTPGQWYTIISRIQKESMAVMNVPCIYGLDMNHGASYAIGATLMPQNVNMAATFNRELAHRGGEITAYETRACDVPWTYCPTVDLSRNPLWPRCWENFGEDAYLTSQMAVATVSGMQGDDPNHIDRYHIAANLKHFMGYGSAVSGKDRTHSSITEQEMREKHFAPYRAAALNGHVLSIMVNSTTNNGVPFHANARYLTRWMKEELDWDGLIVTDWADINNLYIRDYVAKDKKDAIAMAINAGIDMAMEPYSTDFCTLLMELVNEGKVSMARIDDAVARIIRMKMRLGLFEHPDTRYTDYPLFGSDEFAASARQAAEESMVLLKNDNGVLPIKAGARILVTGPNANSLRCLNGGWTYTWQGHRTDELPIAGRYNTILKAMQGRFGNENVVYEPGITYGLTDKWQGNWGVEHVGDLDRVAAAASDVDVIVACVGETSYCETPGNIDDLNLSPNQKELVHRLCATGKPVVLVLNEGRPRLVSDLVPEVAAVVDVMLPSNYGGDALASLLAGDANFSGRLPFTYPRHHGALVAYDYKKGEVAARMNGAYNYEAKIDVQWLFGSGMSYTTFEYSNLRCDKPVFRPGDVLEFKVDVTNTGSRAGKESVLLFASDEVATVSPDVRRLRQFDKVELAPGETRTVTLRVAADELAFVDYDGRWTLEEGDFRIAVGSLSMTVTAAETKVWESVTDYPAPKM